MIKTLLLSICLGMSVHTYSVPAVIVDAGYTSVTYQTEDGNKWMCYGNYSHESVGKSVYIKFCDNGTRSIYDDVILNVK